MANTENMAKWAEALESGEFEQGRNHLAIIGEDTESDKTFYCCLGVACEVAMKNGVELSKMQRRDTGTLVWSYDGESGVLPGKVREWLGLNEDEVSQGGNPYLGAGSATELNDEDGLNFTEIAEHVRATYLTPA